MKACNLSDTISKHARICYQHFKVSDFVHTTDGTNNVEELIGNSKNNRLKKGKMS